MKPFASVIIPAFNASATLRSAIESALGQEGIGEIIVVDDGSTDNSADIARSYGEVVSVLSGPNRGVSHARNQGIAASCGLWLIFLDADDMLAPGSVSVRIAAAIDPIQVVITDWQEVKDDGTGKLGPPRRRSIDWPALRRDAEAAIASHVWATTAAILYPRTIVDAIGGFRSDLPVIQDARYLFDAAAKGACFVHCDHVGASYRILGGSLSRRNPERFWLDVLFNGLQIEERWTTSQTVTVEREKVLAGMFDVAARGLLRAGHPRYRDALGAGSRYDQRTQFLRLAGVMSPVLGLAGTKAVMQALRKI